MKTKKLIVLSICIIIVLLSAVLTICFLSCDNNTDKAPLPTESSKPEEKQDYKAESLLPPEHSEEPTEEPTEDPGFDIDSLSSSAEDAYYGVYYFGKNTYITTDNSERTPSASVIKIFIMQYVYEEIAAGNLSEDDIVSGNSLKNLVKTMIQNSDNNATNILLDHFGMDTINKFIKNSGYVDTEFQRKMLDFTAQENGKENYTSLNDIISFLKNLYNKKDEYPYSTMLDIMKGQNIKTKLPQGLPSGTVIANKTGELSTVENDVGIVFSEGGDFAIVVLTDGVTSPQSTRSAIADLAKQAYDRIN